MPIVVTDRLIMSGGSSHEVVLLGEPTLTGGTIDILHYLKGQHMALGKVTIGDPREHEDSQELLAYALKVGKLKRKKT